MEIKIKQRTPYIDILKYIGIFLLLFEHVGNWVELNGTYNYVKVWVCSFHMPLFFIAYGLAVPFNQKATLEFSIEKIKKRALHLLIPYILWSAIYAPEINYKYFLAAGYGTNRSLSWDGNNAVLWFLPAMFIAIVIDYFSMWGGYRLRRKLQLHSKEWNLIILIIVECIIGLLGHKVSLLIPHNLGIWFSIDIAFIGAAFINAGRILYYVLHKILQKTKKKTIFVITAIGICIITFAIANVNQPKDSWVTIMAWGEYGNNFILFFVNACLSTFGMLLIAYCLNSIVAFASLGEDSLLIMAYHYILFPYTIRITKLLCRDVSLLGYIVFPLLNAVIVLLLSFFINKLLNKFIPNLSGKNILA